MKTAIPEDDSLLLEEDKKHERHVKQYPTAFFQLVLAMGIGTVLSQVLSMTGMTFPIYIGAMIVAAVLRNLSEYTGKFPIYMGKSMALVVSAFHVPWFGDDYAEAVAAGGAGCADAPVADRTGTFDVSVHLFCSV